MRTTNRSRCSGGRRRRRARRCCSRRRSCPAARSTSSAASVARRCDQEAERARKRALVVEQEVGRPGVDDANPGRERRRRGRVGRGVDHRAPSTVVPAPPPLAPLFPLAPLLPPAPVPPPALPPGPAPPPPALPPPEPRPPPPASGAPPVVAPRLPPHPPTIAAARQAASKRCQAPSRPQVVMVIAILLSAPRPTREMVTQSARELVEPALQEAALGLVADEREGLRRTRRAASARRPRRRSRSARAAGSQW